MPGPHAGLAPHEICDVEKFLQDWVTFNSAALTFDQVTGLGAGKASGKGMGAPVISRGGALMNRPKAHKFLHKARQIQT